MYSQLSPPHARGGGRGEEAENDAQHQLIFERTEALLISLALQL